MTQSITLHNIYVPPRTSICLQPLWALIRKSNLSAGDLNVSTGLRHEELSDFCEKNGKLSLVDWSTFKRSKAKFRSETITEAVLSDPQLKVKVIDLNIFPGYEHPSDHCILKICIDIDWLKNEREKSKKTDKKHYFYDYSKVDNNIIEQH